MSAENLKQNASLPGIRQQCNIFKRENRPFASKAWHVQNQMNVHVRAGAAEQDMGWIQPADCHQHASSGLPPCLAQQDNSSSSATSPMIAVGFLSSPRRSISPNSVNPPAHKQGCHHYSNKIARIKSAGSSNGLTFWEMPSDAWHLSIMLWKWLLRFIINNLNEQQIQNILVLSCEDENVHNTRRMLCFRMRSYQLQ